MHYVMRATAGSLVAPYQNSWLVIWVATEQDCRSVEHELVRHVAARPSGKSRQQKQEEASRRVRMRMAG
jgi:hypothetical protein